MLFSLNTGPKVTKYLDLNGASIIVSHPSLTSFNQPLRVLLPPLLSSLLSCSPCSLLPNALSIAIEASVATRFIFMERIRSVMARQMLQRLIAGATEEHCFCAVVKAEFCVVLYPEELIYGPFDTS